MNQAEVKRRQAEALSDVLTWITLSAAGYLTGNNGVTYIVAAYSVFMLIWLPVGGELSDALGRLLRNRYNKGQYKNAETMQGHVMLLQMLMGGFGSLLLFLLAQPVAEGVLRLRYSALILMTLAPTVFLRSVSAVFMGCFQGRGSELPSAATGILRQILILGFGWLLANALKGYGNKVSGLLGQQNFTAMYSGAGIAAAAVIAEFLILLILFVLHKLSNSRVRRVRHESAMRTTDSFMDCARYLYGLRWSGIVTELIAFLPLPLGWLFYGKSVAEEDTAALEYGLYMGKYLVVCGIVTAFITMLALPVIGRGFYSLRREEKRFARAAFQSGIHMCMVQGIFFMAFVGTMATQLAGLLSPENADLVQKMLQGGAALILTEVLTGYLADLLTSMDKKFLVLGTYILSDVLFAVFTAVFLNLGEAGILALVYGGLTASAVCCAVLGVFACRQMRLRIDWLRMLVMPVVAGGAAGFVNMIVKRIFVPHLGHLVTLIVIFAISSVIYWAILLLSRSFREQELEMIPGGKLLNALGQMLHVF